jgi:flagellar FliJ protein
MAKLKKSARLKTVLQLAENREQRAAKILADTRKRLMAAEQQMESLRSYQADYTSNFASMAAKPSHPAMLANYSGFYRSLNRAEEIQQKQIDVILEQLERAMQHWQHQHQRRLNMEKLVNAALASEDLQQEKRLQRELDDRPFKPGSAWS